MNAWSNVEQIKKSVTIFFIVLPALLFLSSCGSDNNINVVAEIDGTIAEQYFDDIHTYVEQAYLYVEDSALTVNEDTVMFLRCWQVSLADTGTEHYMLINFGLDNCRCSDGRLRRGTIVVSYTGDFNAVGTEKNVTFDSFYVNDYKIEGSQKVTNMGVVDGYLTYQNSVTDGHIVKPGNAGTFVYNMQRTCTMLSGDTTRTLVDDVYDITGSGTGTSVDGVSFTTEIVTPLRKELRYKYIVSGIINIQPDGQSLRVLNFGDGSYDNVANIFIGDERYSIQLK
jgi:hypothetical protein